MLQHDQVESLLPVQNYILNQIDDLNPREQYPDDNALQYNWVLLLMLAGNF